MWSRLLLNKLSILIAVLAALTVLAAAGGCSSDGGASGSVLFFAAPEDSIPNGLQPGSGDEAIADGWKIDYSAFTIVIGNVRARRSADPAALLSDAKLTMVNLLDVPAGGLVIASFENADAVRWDRVGFDLANAGASVARDDGVSVAEFDAMVAAGASLHVTGTMTKPGGQSCAPTDPAACVPAPQITFDWFVAAGTSFDDCAPASGDAGFAVPAGGTIQVKPTIHGDHWFFNNITQGAEVTKRYAQWIANADLNHDGAASLDELSASAAADLFPASLYNLSGALVPIVTGRDYLQAQAHTLGDFQGDGECPTRKVL